MRIAYLDCFSGIAGDMFLGALIDAGVPLAVLEEAVAALAIGGSLRVETVDRSGISSKKVQVLEHGARAEAHEHEHPHEHEHESSHEHEHPHVHVHEHPHVHESSHEDKHEHPHKHEHVPPHEHEHEHKHEHDHKHEHEHQHAHDHDHDHEHKHEHEPAAAHAHPHAHGRSLRQIRSLIAESSLDDAVKQLALRTFDLLGHAEARIHNVPVEEIHFHEVGAVDAIVDIVATSAGIHHLGIDAWACSALNVGGGMVACAHGTFPVPAPATADLLRGMPTYSAHLQKELITPTGAALLRALDPHFGPQPAMRVQEIGYGAGTRNPPGFPNVLRLMIGEVADAAVLESLSQKHAGSTGVEAGAETSAASGAARGHAAGDEQKHTHGHHDALTVNVLETALDDLSPQLLAHVAEQAFAKGALDVMLTPVVMKKGRPGTLLTILCNPSDSHALEHLVLRETSTLGIRIRQDRRTCLDRSHTPVETPYGAIRIKVGSLAGKPVNAAPEFEDCRAAAAVHRVAVKQVQQSAIAAWLR